MLSVSVLCAAGLLEAERLLTGRRGPAAEWPTRLQRLRAGYLMRVSWSTD